MLKNFQIKIHRQASVLNERDSVELKSANAFVTPFGKAEGYCAFIKIVRMQQEFTQNKRSITVGE